MIARATGHAASLTSPHASFCKIGELSESIFWLCDCREPCLGRSALARQPPSPNGTIYGSHTGSADSVTAQRIFKITAGGIASVFLGGAPLSRPNGVAIDNDGNVVIVNMGDAAVLTFSSAGNLVRTEQSAQAGSDGVVMLANGTKLVNSVLQGGVSRIKPGRPAELIASGIPGAASACYDTDAKQLVIPMNQNNALALVMVQ